MKLSFVSMIASLALALTGCTTTGVIRPDRSIKPSEITKFRDKITFWVNVPSDQPLFQEKEDRPLLGKVEFICDQKGVLKSIRLVVRNRTVYHCTVKLDGSYDVAVSPNTHYLEPEKWERYFREKLLPHIGEAIPW